MRVWSNATESTKFESFFRESWTKLTALIYRYLYEKLPPFNSKHLLYLVLKHACELAKSKIMVHVHFDAFFSLLVLCMTIFFLSSSFLLWNVILNCIYHGNVYFYWNARYLICRDHRVLKERSPVRKIENRHA